MLKEGNVSWHPNLIKHVVHLDQVYLFAQNAIHHLEFDVEDKEKSVRSLLVEAEFRSKNRKHILSPGLWQQSNQSSPRSLSRF